MSKTKRAEWIVRGVFRNRQVATLDEVKVAFAGRKRLPITFAIWNLVKGGFIERVGRGIYKRA
jgi:predicted transcriptional regulator of viral defense system